MVVGVNKIGLLQESALPFVGQLHHIDIGVSRKNLLKLERKILQITYKDLKTMSLPSLPKNSSKYKRGRTLVIAGSNKYPGASYLALKGAISSGAGFVSAILPDMVAKSIWQFFPEVVLKGSLKSNINGNSILYDAIQNIDLNSYESIVIGPGIGIDKNDWQKSTDYLLNFKGLLILDADALNRISESRLGCTFFLKRKFQTWITPHSAEFMRLFPKIYSQNRVELVLNAAKEFDISILLKGANSIIADKKQAWQIYGTDSETARAGLGDLLSGFISGSSAIELVNSEEINTESFAKYVLLHSFAASKCKNGSNASLIGDKLSKIMRKIKSRQMS